MAAAGWDQNRSPKPMRKLRGSNPHGHAMIYRQCKLEKGGCVQTISYLPEKYAVLGDVVKLKDNLGWDDGWVVISVSHSRDDVPDVRKVISGHRRATGDSLAKIK